MSEISVLVDKLRAEGEKTIRYFESMTDDQWTIEIYTENATWTIRNVLSHLMTSERAFEKLFENIRQKGNGVTDDFIIDRYNASQQKKTKDLGPSELIGMYKTARANMISWLSGIEDADLDKVGRHPYLGQTTLREMVKMIYLHNQIHNRDIKNVVNQ